MTFTAFFFSSKLQESCFMTIPKSRPWESALTLLWRVSCSEPGWALRKRERCYISHCGNWATTWKQSASLPLISFCPERKNTWWQVTLSKSRKITWKYKGLRLFQNSVYGYMMKRYTLVQTLSHRPGWHAPRASTFPSFLQWCGSDLTTIHLLLSWRAQTFPVGTSTSSLLASLQVTISLQTKKKPRSSMATAINHDTNGKSKTFKKGY